MFAHARRCSQSHPAVLEGVVAVTAPESVVAVASIQRVVAGTAEEGVIAVEGADEGRVAAVEAVVSGSADDDVVAARGRFEVVVGVVVARWSVPGGDCRGVCVLNGAGCGSGILLRARRAARNRPWRVACTCGTRPVGRAGPPGSAS